MSLLGFWVGEKNKGWGSVAWLWGQGWIRVMSVRFGWGI